MRLKVDKESDALYFKLDESPIVESEEAQPGVILDFNADGKVVGIEIRYDDIPELSLDDAKEAISIAEQVKSFVM